MIEYIIDEDYESVRVDRFLRKHLKNINLSEIYKMLRKGKIKVNNKKISQDYRLVLGDIVFIFLPESFKENNEKKFIELNQVRKEKLKQMIVFENDNLFVINNHWEMLFIKVVDTIFLYLKNLEVIIQIII